MKYYLSKPLGKEEIKSIKNVTEVHMFDKPCFVQEVMSKAYGYITCSKCIGYYDYERLDLIAVKEIRLTLKYIGRDTWGRYVYEDQNGKLWKHINCLSSREKCIERQDTLYSAYNNEFEGEPDCHMNPICSANFIC